jgi:hypothetical protein
MYHRYKLLDLIGINIVTVFHVVIFTDWHSVNSWELTCFTNSDVYCPVY